MHAIKNRQFRRFYGKNNCNDVVDVKLKGDKMAKKVKKVKGFQMNKKTGHPSKIISQKGKHVKSYGFTHNGEGGNKKLLSHNIDPRDSKKCYVKTVIEKQVSSDYRTKKEYMGYRVHKDDYHILIEIRKKDKQ